MKDRPALVFIVDDDDAVRNSIRLILDVRMPGMSGLELQQQLNLRGAIIPVIFITGHGDVPMAVEAMQQGAFDFLQKPSRDQDLIERVQRALAKDQLNRAELSERTVEIHRARVVEKMHATSLASLVRMMMDLG